MYLSCEVRDIKVYDDFLEEEDRRNIWYLFMRNVDYEKKQRIVPGLPWSWVYRVTQLDWMDPDLDPLENYFFCHSVYTEGQTIQPFTMKKLMPVINKLDTQFEEPMRALLRIKCNLGPRRHKRIRFGFHTDFDFDCMTAIYYVNGNNGCTEFDIDGYGSYSCESVRNRLVLFPSHYKHSVVSCTDAKKRIVINFNYM